MGLREWFNKHPKAAYCSIGAVILLCFGMIVEQVLASRHVYPPKPPDVWFTSDDGKSYFRDSSTRVPPFDHNGQPAVRAYVFIDANGKKFVGLLERFNFDVAGKLNSGAALTAEMSRSGRELKLPGDTQWIKSGNMKVEAALTSKVKSPSGAAVADAVDP